MSAELHALQEMAGARFSDLAGTPVARHYGDGAAEYAAIRESAGIAVRSDLVPLRMWGRDPVKMLHGLVTNDITAVTPDRGTYAVMLTPKGRTIAEMRVFRRSGEGAELLLLLPRESLDGASAHLKKFVPPMFSRWSDASPELGVLGVYGPSAGDLVHRVVRQALPAEQEESFTEVMFHDFPLLIAFSREAGGEPGLDITAPAEALPSLWQRLVAEGGPLGARPVGFGALETTRIEAGRPRFGAELSEQNIPTEAFEPIGWIPRAISFTKGCYTGQEVIVRIAHRGHVNRLLRGLLLGDSPTPAPGTPLINPATGREVGWTTSAAISPMLQQTVSLAFVRRELEPGGVVHLHTADGAAAQIVELPFAREPRHD